jgi:YD repeat-containing protein
VRSYTYNYANRLVQVVSGTVTMTFTYNGDGHRVAKSENGVTTTYVVAVLGLSQALVETTDGEMTRYVYGHELLVSRNTRHTLINWPLRRCGGRKAIELRPLILVHLDTVQGSNGILVP